MDWPLVVLLLGLTAMALLMVVAFERIMDRQEPLDFEPSEAEYSYPVDDWLAGKLADRVIVHTKDGHSLRGDVRQMTDQGLLLCGAKLLTEGIPTPVEGDVAIPRANVSFIQRLTVSE